MYVVGPKIPAQHRREGRLTVLELAQRVGLSVVPCRRRLRELERSGAIRGYRELVNLATEQETENSAIKCWSWN
jgi:DNA-binding Lrp family transcriptional regulator